MEYKKFVIIIPSYNNSKWYAKNLGSVFGQNFPRDKFRVLYFDDFSSDNTFKLVTDYSNKYKNGIDVQIIRNEKNYGALYNIHNAITNYCQSDEIACFLDGDDWQSDSNALNKVNAIFNNIDTWFLWTQYKSASNNRLGCSASFPQEVYQSNSFRNQSWRISHQHFGIVKLFQQIPKEALLYKDNQYFKTGWDIPLYCSTIELAGNHAIHIPEVTMIYNDLSEINDYKKDLKAQQDAAEYGFKMPKLQPLNKLF